VVAAWDEPRASDAADSLVPLAAHGADMRVARRQSRTEPPRKAGIARCATSRGASRDPFTCKHFTPSGRPVTGLPICDRSGSEADVTGVGVEELRPVVASPRSLLALGNQWETSDPDAVRLDRDDASVLERLSELGQVVLEERRLVGWPVLAAVSEQDHRRRGLLAGGQGAFRNRCPPRRRLAPPCGRGRRSLRRRRSACPARGRGRHRGLRG
jgi:hypothetical protein